MAISAHYIVEFTRHRVSAPSLLWWAYLRGGLSRLLPAIIALWTRIPGILHIIAVPSLASSGDSTDSGAGDFSKTGATSSCSDGEGMVTCEVLYAPSEENWTMDIIFIHGLHGSTVKTWRQGDWNSKYQQVQRVPLRNHTSSSAFNIKQGVCPNCHLLKRETSSSIHKDRETPTEHPALARSYSVPVNAYNNNKGEEEKQSKKAPQVSRDKMKSCHKIIFDNKSQTYNIDRKRETFQSLEENEEKCTDSDDDILYFNVHEELVADNSLIRRRSEGGLENINDINDYSSIEVETSVNEIEIDIKDNIKTVFDKIESKDGVFFLEEEKELVFKVDDKIEDNCDTIEGKLCDIRSKNETGATDDIIHEFIYQQPNNITLQNCDIKMDNVRCDNMARNFVKTTLEYEKKVVNEKSNDAGLFEDNFKDIKDLIIDVNVVKQSKDERDNVEKVRRNMKRRCEFSDELRTVNIIDQEIIKLRKVYDEEICIEKDLDSSNRNSFDKYAELENGLNDLFSFNNGFKQYDGINEKCDNLHNPDELDELTIDLLKCDNLHNPDELDELTIDLLKCDNLHNPDELDELTIDLLKCDNLHNPDELDELTIDLLKCDNLHNPDELDELTIDILKKMHYLEESSTNFTNLIKDDQSCINLDTNSVLDPTKDDYNTLENDSKINKTDQVKSMKDAINEPSNDAQDTKNMFDRSKVFCMCEGVKIEDRDDEDIKEALSSCWPRDWLPLDCPGARVISLSYTTDQNLWRPIWVKPYSRTSLNQRSQEMVKQLASLKSGSKPIIWVGHSKGGLFIKQMFSNGHDSWRKEGSSSDSARIYLSSKALIFYSVPHRGSPLANITLPPLLRVSSELEEIQHESEFVLKLHERFLAALKNGTVNPSILSYSETRRTLMGAFYLRIVSAQSADPGVGNYYGVSLDHREICKPTSRSCFLYKELLSVISHISSSIEN